MDPTKKKVISDMVKSFSCAYSTTKNLNAAAGLENDPVLLNSAVGFGGGVASMGDTCGAVNGGVMVLGKKLSFLPSEKVYFFCSEYFSRLEATLGTPNCGRIHGGRHLTKNFRRNIATGKVIKCMTVLRHGTDIIKDISRMTDTENYTGINSEKYDCIKKASEYFEQKKFHCGCSTIGIIKDKSGLETECLSDSAKGFIGGIGFNGTLCGAVAGGVLCLGLANRVDLSKCGYSDTMKLFVYGLIKNDAVFEDEKIFLPAKLFSQCEELYTHIEETYGSAHCYNILNLKLDQHEDMDGYINNDKITFCKKIAEAVADKVCTIIERNS